MKAAKRVLAIAAVAMLAIVPAGKALGMSVETASAVAGAMAGTLTAVSFTPRQNLQVEAS